MPHERCKFLEHGNEFFRMKVGLNQGALERGEFRRMVEVLFGLQRFRLCYAGPRISSFGK
jgi:hypothetical protein